MGEKYVLVTNRFDLTTYQVIMLYAYRWQIGLFFRFIKRTLNCIHLFSHDCKGIQVQFYLYMIVHTLLLAFKQECEQISDEHKEAAADLPCTKNSINRGLHKDASTKTGRIYVSRKVLENWYSLVNCSKKVVIKTFRCKYCLGTFPI